MKNYYLKPWTVIFVLLAFLAAVFTACKNEVELEEPDYLGGDIDHSTQPVKQKWGSVILTDQGAVILSDSALWDEEDSIKTIVIPKTSILQSDIIDLSDYIGRRLEFSGSLCRGGNKIWINGEKQRVYLFYLLLADLHISEGSRAGETPKQIICGTQFTDEDYANVLALSMSRQGIEDSNPLIKTYVSVLRRKNEQGLNKEIVANKVLNNLNNIFATTGIRFALYRSQYLDIVDDNLRDNATDIDVTNYIFNNYNHNDALDIFVFKDADNQYSYGELAGRAQGVLSNACIVYDDYYTSHDLGHEVGHCLGLFHTHHGTSEGERGKGTVPELVNGSNSAYAGDLIIDTPADPNTWDGGVFHDTGLRDLNGDIYNPDPFNLMSYSYKGRLFTPMQAQKMLTALNSSSQLKNIIVHREILNKHLRAGDIISVKDLLPADQIQWTYSTDLDEYDKISNARYIVTSTEESQFYNLKANITTAEGKTIELTGKATSGAPNPDLGMIEWTAVYDSDDEYGAGYANEEGKCGMSYEDGMYYWSDINVYGGTTLDLRYCDLACGPIPCSFKCVTSTRVMEDYRFIITPADCANGYLEFYVRDKYGQIDESRVFQIMTNVYGQYYAARVKNGSITFEGRLGKSLKKSASAPRISKIEIYNKAGKLILSEARQKVSVAALSLTPLAKGEYKAIVSDNDFSQEIFFEI